MTGWRAGLGPWEPILEDGRLYGHPGYASTTNGEAHLVKLIKDPTPPAR
jgi:hypothetical protein